MAKKTPASSLFLDVSLRPGPWVRGVPWGPEEAVPGVPRLCRDLCRATRGDSTAERLLWWNDSPRFWTNALRQRRGCGDGVSRDCVCWGVLWCHHTRPTPGVLTGDS